LAVKKAAKQVSQSFQGRKRSWRRGREESRWIAAPVA